MRKGVLSREGERRHGALTFPLWTKISQHADYVETSRRCPFFESLSLSLTRLLESAESPSEWVSFFKTDPLSFTQPSLFFKLGDRWLARRAEAYRSETGRLTHARRQSSQVTAEELQPKPIHLSLLLLPVFLLLVAVSGSRLRDRVRTSLSSCPNVPRCGGGRDPESELLDFLFP